MLRSLVLVLMLVNAAFYAWSQGWLNEVVGIKPDAQHEPQRLTQQVHADKLIVLKGPVPTVKQAPAAAAASAANASSVASAASTASAASVAASASVAAAPAKPAPSTPAPSMSRVACLEAGPFSAAEQSKLEASLKPMLPPKAWTTDNVTVQGLWLVYMGPYPDNEAMARKESELKRIRGLNFEEITAPASLTPGLSLGRYGRLEDANAALNTLRNRGIRTARVVTLRPIMELQVVRVPQADSRTQTALAGLKLPAGKGFTACRP